VLKSGSSSFSVEQRRFRIFGAEKSTRLSERVHNL